MKTNYEFFNKEILEKNKLELVPDKLGDFYRYRVDNTCSEITSLIGRDSSCVTILSEVNSGNNNFKVEWINHYSDINPTDVCYDVGETNDNLLSCGTIANDSWLEFHKDIIFNSGNFVDSIDEIYKPQDEYTLGEENKITITDALYNELTNIKNIANSVLGVLKSKSEEDINMVNKATEEYLENLSKIREEFINIENNKGE